MKIVVMGCGRVGSSVACRLDGEGHDVTVIDTDPRAFERFIPSTFSGTKLVGSGTDQRKLEEAGIAEADAFLALTHGDNRNILAAQLAHHQYGVKSVVARLLDPFRAEIFARLGIRTFSPTSLGAGLAYDALMESEVAGEAATAD